MLNVEKILPVLLMGNTSKNKLIVEANNKKLSAVLPFNNLKFLKIKIINKPAIISVIKNPIIPVSAKISK